MAHKTLGHRFFLTSILLVFGCASKTSQEKEFLLRSKKVNYEVSESAKTPYDLFFQKHFLLEMTDGYRAHGFNLGDDYIVVTDGGETETKDVSCTLVKAQGRQQILNWISNQLYLQNQGKPWDLTLRIQSKKVLSEKLSIELRKVGSTFFYWEKRVRELSEDDKNSFVCAVAIKVSEESFRRAVSPLKEEIEKESSIKKIDQLDLSFPISDSK